MKTKYNNLLILYCISFILVLLSTSALAQDELIFTKYHIWWIDQQGDEHSTLISEFENLDIPMLTFVTNGGQDLWGLYEDPIFSFSKSYGCAKEEFTKDEFSSKEHFAAMKYPVLNAGILEDQFTNLMDENCHVRKIVHIRRRLFKLGEELSRLFGDESGDLCPKKSKCKDLNLNIAQTGIPEQISPIDITLPKIPRSYFGTLKRKIKWVGQIGHFVLFDMCETLYAYGAHENIKCRPYIIDLVKYSLISHTQLNISDYIINLETPYMKTFYQKMIEDESFEIPFRDPQWVGLHIKNNAYHNQLFNVWQADTCFACSSEDWSSYTYRFLTPLSSASKKELPNTHDKLPAVIKQFIRNKKVKVFGWNYIHNIHYTNIKNSFTHTQL